MARRRSILPSYRNHKSSGRAVIDVYRHDGTRTTITLTGLHGSPESKADYESLLAILWANGGVYRLPRARTRPWT
jgi:hypothetical protein